MKRSGVEKRKFTRKMISPASEFIEADADIYKPLVTIVVPAFNEEAIIKENLEILKKYLETLEDDYCWEIIIINDGSSDKTGEYAESFAEVNENVFVFHHITNFGLGQAFNFAFSKSKGDYVVTIDIDLSYSPDHIGRLLENIRVTRAKMVLASPYMKGGKISNVPVFRKTLSILANRFLSIFAHGHLSTLTCMVRAYDGKFIRSLVIRSQGMEVMPETIYKSMILRARIEQIPAELDWGLQNKAGQKRKSSMKVFKHILSTILAGFVFRPFMFFILPGLFILIFALYTNFWAIMHFIDAYLILPETTASDRISEALSISYNKYPYTYLVGLVSLMLAIQLISLGIQALQSKTYYEELFYLGSRIFRMEEEMLENSIKDKER